MSILGKISIICIVASTICCFLEFILLLSMHEQISKLSPYLACSFKLLQICESPIKGFPFDLISSLGIGIYNYK